MKETIQDFIEGEGNMFDEEFPTDYIRVVCPGADYSASYEIKSFHKSSMCRLLERVLGSINESIGDDFEISYTQDVDITKLSNELIAEMNGAKKATLGTKKIITDILNSYIAEMK
ncbi:MAG: hypothetical protein ABI134_14050 [Byssovorax sp.]